MAAEQGLGDTIQFVRFAERLKGSGESDVKPASPLMNRIFGGALNVESKLVRRVTFPFGLSVIVVAQKPA